MRTTNASRNSTSTLRTAALDSLQRLDPRVQWRNPVMFVVYVGAAFCTVYGIVEAPQSTTDSLGQTLVIAALLWLTVLFANFADALAEGRSKAQSASLRSLRGSVTAHRLESIDDATACHDVPASALRRNDLFVVRAGETIPADGTVVDGVASVDESAITGESAPVIREAGGDFSAVTGGTRVLSDWLIVRVSSEPGESFVDRMIAMVDNAKRRKTPNEIALTILLVALTIVFLAACATLVPFTMFAGAPISTVVVVALLVCLIPTTIGALLSAIGVAGMSRMLAANVVATSGRAIEAAGDIDVLLMDKTGTITLGNRQAASFVAAPGVTEIALASAAQLASRADETPEGRSIVALSKRLQATEDDLGTRAATFVGFSAQTRMSGIDIDGRQIRKGAPDAIRAWLRQQGLERIPPELDAATQTIARAGATPLWVAELAGSRARVLGAIELRDIVKSGIRERFAELRRIGIKTVMITGDNPITAAAVAAQAGVDDYVAEATPETKLRLIREYQRAGHMVAMTGDGTNDAPALAQADVGVAMNTGTQAAREAGNMVDLDSNPTKLIEIVAIGKNILMTRGALTTFSIANDIAKYFAIIPAAFASTYPSLASLDLMHLTSPNSAVLAAVIFNALIILALVPLALRGVTARAADAEALLRRNLIIYGGGGLVVPFIGIKLLDMLLAQIGFA